MKIFKPLTTAIKVSLDLNLAATIREAATNNRDRATSNALPVRNIIKTLRCAEANLAGAPSGPRLDAHLEELRGIIAAFEYLGVACEAAVKACQAAIDSTETYDAATMKTADKAAYSAVSLWQVAQLRAFNLFAEFNGKVF